MTGHLQNPVKRSTPAVDPWPRVSGDRLPASDRCGTRLGLIKATKDATAVEKSQTDAMATYGNEEEETDIDYCPAVRILKERGAI